MTNTGPLRKLPRVWLTINQTEGLADFVNFAEQLAEGLPDRPGYLVPDVPDFSPDSRAFDFDSMLKRPSKSIGGGFRKRVRTGPSPAAKAAVTKIARSVALKTHELKEVNVNVLGTAVTNSCSFALLNGVPQSVGGGGRIGRDVLLQGIELRYQLNTNANVNDPCRVLVVYDKECRGAIFAQADLLSTTTAAFCTVSTYNTDNKDVRFKILYDRVHDQQSLTTTSVRTTSHKVNLRCTYKTHYYDNASAAITAIDSGSLYLVWVNYSGAVSTISYDVNVRYRDV